MRKAIRCLTLVTAAIFGMPAWAQNAVTVCSADYQPYTKSDVDEGMFTEIVRAAFKAEGLTVNWEVLPPVRCNAMTGRTQ